MAGILGEYTEIFLEESEEQIEELNANLLLLEKDHTNPEIINDIFRAAHSLKSSAAFVGLYNLSDLAHKMENLLQKIREEKITIHLELVNLLFECFDLIKSVIDSVGRGEKRETDFSEMIEKLNNYEKSQEGSPPPTTSAPKPEVSKPERKEPEKKGEPVKADDKSVKESEFHKIITIDDDEMRELEEEVRIRNAGVFDVSVKIFSETPMKGLRFALILQNLKLGSIVFKSEPEIEQLEKGVDTNVLYIVLISSMDIEKIRQAIQVDMVEQLDISRRSIQVSQFQSKDSSDDKKTKKQDKVSQDKEITDSRGLTKSIKVSSEKLDQLMNNVGELVITNSGFQKIYDDLVRNFGDDILFAELKSKIDQINRISKDLQTGIMNTRMVPIGSVFNRFSRLVRDLSVETGKKVQLILQGENTELDKKVVDMIGEPMLHLIRNSIDHGIETPEERKKSGKPENGTVELNAYQGGNNIMVEIRDDGKGLNKNSILKKAIEKGLVNQNDASGLADSDIYQFIFAPGFSTAAQVTDISGRGVGMNVVNKLIQDFKGKILINSIEGTGTSFTLCFPQALAIIPSILVSMEEEIYAFPLSEVFETIRIKKDQVNTLEGNEIINLRGEVLPIYRLNKIIGLADKKDVMEFPVVIVNYNSRKLGFIVDELIGKHETVIKTLEKNFKNIKGLTGASIMGDGTIILVLDISGLIDLAAIQSQSEETTIQGKKMLRLTISKSMDIISSNDIFKTLNATNKFNARLLEMKMATEKSKKKKDKQEKKRQLVQVEEPAFTQETVETQEEEIINEKNETEQIQEETVNEEAKAQEIIPNDSVSYSEPVSTNENDSDESTGNNVLFNRRKKKANKEEKVESAPIQDDIPVETDEPELSKPEEYIPEEKDEDDALKNVMKDLSAQTMSRVESLTPDRNINDLLSREEIRKLESVINTGMMNAGLVLSQLVGANVELFMPEIMLSDKETLREQVRNPDEVMFGLKVRINGDLNGNLLMILSEDKGKELADKLLKNEESDLAKKMSEDHISVLTEISNIVCASLINSLSNKAKAQIMPDVPELITGDFRELMDAVKPEKTKFLSMSTEFIYEGDNVIGNLIFLPDFDELIKLISKL
ncbi:MAG: chemotaxis protein CheW [Leptospiraceae bacterium]|nr:chemotaxis protein CheW [Leptospiraceae bacterium]